MDGSHENTLFQIYFRCAVYQISEFEERLRRPIGRMSRQGSQAADHSTHSNNGLGDQLAGAGRQLVPEADEEFNQDPLGGFDPL